MILLTYYITTIKIISFPKLSFCFPPKSVDVAHFETQPMHKPRISVCFHSSNILLLDPRLRSPTLTVHIHKNTAAPNLWTHMH